MKVLQINSVSGIKSTGRICTDIADVLISKGHDCKIASGREAAPDKYKDITIYTDTSFGVKLHAIQSRIFDNAGFARKQATRKFISRIREFNSDIIHLHNIHGYFINVEELFFYLLEVNKPVIWTLHDGWAFTGHCTYPSRANCDKWKEGCFKCPQKRSYPKSFLVDSSKKNYNMKKRLFTNLKNMTIVTPSQWLADYVGESFLSKYPIEIIHNGIDTNIFSHRESSFRVDNSLENKKVILGVASPWGKRKGLDDFIELSKQLKESYCIVLVGITDKQRRRIPKEIITIGQINNPLELAKIYSAADVFVNLTYADNYPTVNLEAQSCGTPTITYKTGGSVESVPNCQVVGQGDIQGVKNLIYSICEKGQYLLFDRNAFERQKVFERYVELYNSKMI
ncbi:MAG: glycosyltransferase [Firmicutes bacterium]|nr:glycosyltransferase [Bacillota bacterium]